MKPFINFISESAINIPRNSLDPAVFSFIDGMAPILNGGIKQQILTDLQTLQQLVGIKEFFIVGSILTKTYTPTCDIDVTIALYKEDMDDVIQAKTLTLLKGLNGHLAMGTQHPINYYVELNDIIEDNFDGIYDVVNERWKKEPKFFELNVQNYITKFQTTVSQIDITTAQLRRDIIDFEELSQFSEGEIKNLKEIMQSKLYEINRGIENLVGAKKLISHSRKEAFARPLTPDEIIKYKSKNTLPENIVYKLLQKYYYFEFISKLENILGDKEKINTNDVQKIKKAEKEFYDESYKTEVRTTTLVVFGVSDDTGNTRIEIGTKNDSHNMFAMATKYGNSFRYLPKTKNIYWWEHPTQQMIEGAIEKLNAYGYSVNNPQLDITEDDNYLDTHHPKDAEDGMRYTHESIKLNKSVLLEAIRSVKLKKIKWGDPDSLRGSHLHKTRGLDRKNMRQVPDVHRAKPESFGAVMSAKDSVEIAKGAPSGIWKITPSQAKWIARKYHHIPPDAHDNIKHLGNTGIMVWRKTPNNYFLVKPTKRFMHPRHHTHKRKLF